MTERLIIRDDGDVATREIAEFEASRREALKRGLALTGGVLSASSIPLLLAVRNAFAAASGDATVLQGAIDLEQVAVFSYQAAYRSGVLSPAFRSVARKFAGQEQEHASALIKALAEVGGGPPPPKPSRATEVDAAVGRLGIAKGLSRLKSEADIATYAIELETVAVSAYYEAHAKLQNAALLMASAQIMSNEGQHLVVLRTVTKRDPVPNAFETGKASK